MILTKKQIFRMTIPALTEQALLQMVLALNLIFVSSAGASTVSGVSFVDQITITLVYFLWGRWAGKRKIEIPAAPA